MPKSGTSPTTDNFIERLIDFSIIESDLIIGGCIRTAAMGLDASYKAQLLVAIQIYKAQLVELKLLILKNEK